MPRGGSGATRAPNLDELVIWAAAEVVGRGEALTFPGLVAECFKHFPQQFGLEGYPEWPDSARVNKCWLRCRSDRGWLTGNPSRGFRVTAAGEGAAEYASRLLSEGRPEQRAANPGCEKLLRFIRRSDGFLEFTRTGSSPGEEELRSSLGATLETPRLLLRERLNEAQACAKTFEDQLVLDYLEQSEGVLGDLKRPWRKDAGRGAQ